METEITPTGKQAYRTPLPYRICARCIMDTSDSELSFDENGVCFRCIEYDQVMAAYVFPGEEGQRMLDDIVREIKAEGRGKKYDCIIGLSGGVDSTYVAYLVKKLGLRPLAIHLDNGWNSEIAVGNIERIVKILGIDLYTEVLDWDEFRRLQLAFLRASTPDSEIPTDHAIVSTLYRQAIKHGVRFIISGGNFATEQMIPRTWSHGHDDWKYIRTLNRMFGGKKLKSYPHYTFFDKRYYFPFIKRLRTIMILNYIEYDKFKAIELMHRELGWVPYGGKHHESIYTRFYQSYILPRKFGGDKRRPHMSCLINDHRITRDQALAEIQQLPDDEDTIEQDRQFVIKKLGITEAEFEAIMNAEPKTTWEYPTDEVSPPRYDAVIRAMIKLARTAQWFSRGVARRLSRVARGLSQPVTSSQAVQRGVRALSPPAFVRDLSAGLRRVLKGLGS
jgi:N-acetyl sugar amidotransferase